ncbi:unnamed protein product, partial [Amoebophrya sp. A120]
RVCREVGHLAECHTGLGPSCLFSPVLQLLLFLLPQGPRDFPLGLPVRDPRTDFGV